MKQKYSRLNGGEPPTPSLTTEVVDLGTQSEVRSTVGRSNRRPYPVKEPKLTTVDIAAILHLSVKTAQRLCHRGEIDADKTRGGRWLTTLDRLNGSPYMKGGRKKRGSNAALEQ